MRLLLAMMMHETNSFSPVATPASRFHSNRGTLMSGKEALEAYKGTGSSLGGLIAAAEAAGAEIVCALAALGWPSGTVDDSAFEEMASIITGAIDDDFDGILLDLHGAMVTQTHESAERELLERIRQMKPDIPIGVCLDMHANLSPEMVRCATVVCGYHTYPHIDMFEAGLRTGELLVRTIKGEIRPTMACGKLPMLPHVMRQGTHLPPNRRLQDYCIELEKDRALAASVFVGFPHSDISRPGLSAVAVTENDTSAAEAIVARLLDEAWALREEFVYAIEPLEVSIERARTLAHHEGRPIVLLDHFDNAASGGTMDTTVVLAEVIRQGLKDVAMFGIYDPEFVGEAIQAGIGAKISTTLGGRLEMPTVARKSAPLSISGTVKTISAGTYRNKGPMSRGVEMRLGTTVVFDTGDVEIVVTSRHQEPNDENAFLALGIDPRQKRYLVLKSRVHWRAGLGHLAGEVVECAGLGVCTSDYSEIPYTRLDRPIFPIDRDMSRPS